MRTSRVPRLAAACRVLSLTLSLLLVSAAALSAATLSGRVLDPDGRPMPGARVLATNALGTLADRSTGDDGRFEMTGLGAGEYTLRVIADGFIADPMRVTIAASDTRTVELKVRLAAITESVVVSAAQVDVPLSGTPDSVTVISGADLQTHQVETVADALRLVPGLAVVRSGDRGAITSIFPRGGGSNYTLVLVDGIRANAFGGGFDFGHLALADIDRIEVVRGPESALYGSDAIGGVVQVVTKRGGAPRVAGTFEHGSQNTTRVVIDGSGSANNWSWGGGLVRTSSDGFTGTAPATGENVSNDNDQLTRGSASIGWQRPGGVDVLVNGNVGRDERGFPGPFGSNPIGVYGGVDRVSRGANNTRQIGGRFSNPWSATVRQRVDASYSNIASDFTSQYGPSTSGSGRTDLRVQEDVVVARALAASVGVEYQRERGSSSFITNAAGDAIDIRRGVTGFFGEARYAGGDRLSVTGGVRVERLTRDALEKDAFGSRPAFADQTINSFNPKIAVSYLMPTSLGATSPTRLHASAGTGIRPPDAFEIAFTDNPNLKPERTRSVDAGIEQQLRGGAFAIGATAFMNRYDDLLITVGRSLLAASHYKTDNISNARASGLELSAAARLSAALTLRGSYTLLNTDILSVDGINGAAPSPFKVGDALIRRPHHQGALSITWAGKRLTAFGEMTSRSQALDIEPNFGASGGLFFAPGSTVVNTGASVRLHGDLEVYARVMNLANRAYEETLGYPALGRSGMVGIRIAAGR